MTINRVSYLFFLLTITFLFSASVLSAQETPAGDANVEQVIAGEKLFKLNCTACHKLGGKLIGPDLNGVVERWEAAGEYQGVTGKEWLHRWIKNYQDPVNAGYPYAVSMLSFDASNMNPFPTLSDGDIDAILTYIQNPDLVAPTGPTGSTGTVVQTGGGQYTELFLYILIALLVIIALILLRVSNVLGRLVAEKEGEKVPELVPFYKNRKLHIILALFVIIWLCSTLVNGAIGLGRQQGYAPVQPIKFSHEIHAGIDKIDCKYCHVGASESKHSVIPSLNICMNCHKGINEATKYGEYGRKEISKIYASIGFNPIDLSYFEDYENMPYDSVAAVFTEWLNGDKVKPTDKEIEAVLNQIQKPVEWVRIHNLPDHVYFNHAQHVTVAGLDCQRCHGPVETMKVLKQHSPLSMGWCISCHRQTEVNFSGNNFYDSYTGLHEKLEKKELDKVTVETIGGTECQKCHY